MKAKSITNVRIGHQRELRERERERERESLTSKIFISVPKARKYSTVNRLKSRNQIYM